MGNNVIDYCVPLLQKLDYGITDYNKRLDIVKELFNQNNENVVEGLDGLDDFWIDLFEQTSDSGLDTSHTKTVLNQNDSLYSDSDISKMLEIIGTYLLMSPDKKDVNKHDKIKIYNSKELFNRALKERDKVKKLLSVNPDDFTLDILVKQKNYKKATDIKISKKDIEQNKYLKNYDSFLNELKLRNKELSIGNKLKKQDLIDRRIIRKNIASIKSDMEYIYLSEHRPIKFKQPLMGTGSVDWDNLDMMECDVLHELLKINKSDDINNDLNCILLDLEILLRRINFTPKQKEILYLYRNGYRMSEIGDTFNCSRQHIHSMLKGCIKKIVNSYMDLYCDWYYLNICKGEYKTCSNCNENLLIHNFSKKGKNHRCNCKKCEKRERESLKNEKIKFIGQKYIDK